MAHENYSSLHEGPRNFLLLFNVSMCQCVSFSTALKNVFVKLDYPHKVEHNGDNIGVIINQTLKRKWKEESILCYGGAGQIPKLQIEWLTKITRLCTRGHVIFYSFSMCQCVNVSPFQRL